jgi:hypothetical protein
MAPMAEQTTKLSSAAVYGYYVAALFFSIAISSILRRYVGMPENMGSGLGIFIFGILLFPLFRPRGKPIARIFARHFSIMLAISFVVFVAMSLIDLIW